jgi:hypothetical protein
VQKVYTRCKHKAGVNKIGGIHALRHYSACQIMPNGGFSLPRNAW